MPCACNSGSSDDRTRAAATIAGIATLFAAIVVALHFAFGLSLWWLFAAPVLTVLVLAIGGLAFVLMWMASGGH